MEERLDKILLQRGLVSSRVRAEQIIREVGVKVNGKLISKTGKKFPLDAEIEMMAEELPWVSRGALKLLEALENWNPPIEEACILDIGASTGGFTEVLLSRHAKKVYCIDVGKGQLHAKLKADEEEKKRRAKYGFTGLVSDRPATSLPKPYGPPSMFQIGSNMPGSVIR